MITEALAGKHTWDVTNFSFETILGLIERKLVARYKSPERAMLYDPCASALKAGLMLGDMLSTVSRRYAFEIQTREQCYGLDWLLRMRRERLFGITNGVDYDVWNPATDPHIAAHFTAEDLAGKRECKRDLLRRFSLPEELERPVVAIISRLVAQKGYDLIQQAAGRSR